MLAMIWEGLICLAVFWAGAISLVEDSESESETVILSLSFLASSLEMPLVAICSSRVLLRPGELELCEMANFLLRAVRIGFVRKASALSAASR